MFGRNSQCGKREKIHSGGFYHSKRANNYSRRCLKVKSSKNVSHFKVLMSQNYNISCKNSSLVHRDNGYIHKRDLYSFTKQVFVYIKLASNLLKFEQSQLEVILFRKILRKLIPLTVTVTLSLTLSLTLTTTLTLNCICKFNSQSKSKIKYTIPQTVILSVTLTMTSTRICICKFNSKSKIKYTIENNKYHKTLMLHSRNISIKKINNNKTYISYLKTTAKRRRANRRANQDWHEYGSRSIRWRRWSSWLRWSRLSRRTARVFPETLNTMSRTRHQNLRVRRGR